MSDKEREELIVMPFHFRQHNSIEDCEKRVTRLISPNGYSGQLHGNKDMQRMCYLFSQWQHQQERIEELRALLIANYESDDNEYGSDWWINSNDELGEFMFDDAPQALKESPGD